VPSGRDVRLDFSSRKIQLPKCRIGYTYADSALNIKESHAALAEIAKTSNKANRFTQVTATYSLDEMVTGSIAR